MGPLDSCFSKCGPQTSSISIIQELAKHEALGPLSDLEPALS